ncbi:fatty acyl-AMP ligase [Nonomuraea sp. PA05]|uniref:fatty acyl-AMP ligase n=1 Tax=Nonomuraea sp. PA05 TaxID=2604466 RepID=UPI0011D5EB93|nr:fatty acyl-AMP ligase [Nonomuraea sp. PA05]TYB54712.1 fatty acyl-AMP ligase [Nonomuraea sp. PA05]
MILHERISATATFTFQPDTGPAARITHAELAAQARAAARWFTEQGLPGRAVLLAYPPGTEFTAAFLGCLYAGVLAIPVPDPAGARLAEARLDRIRRDASAAAVLGPGSVPSGPDPGLGRWTPPAPGETAYLQYTSGSTSEPRGVAVTHDALHHNLATLDRLFGPAARRGMVGWLPHHHDMGLVGLHLSALYLGADLTFCSPAAFITRPARWLRLLTSSRAGLTVAPDFGYAWAARRVTDEQLAGLDLSGLSVAITGAEPIRPATLDAFTQRFAATGFDPGAWHPCYGLAEATLLASCSRGAAVRGFATEHLESHRAVPSATGTPLVSCGSPVDLEMRIVDPRSHAPLPDGRVGEIWLSGSSVAGGYHGNPAATEEVFHAHTSDGDGPYLRTGDLGFRLDGELYVTGRHGDLIIVNGRNLYPQDLEHAAHEAHTGAGAAAAFGLSRADTEHVVLIQELHHGPPDAVAASVLRRVSREFGVPVSLVLLTRGAIRRTTSGKVRRRHMRELFLRGELRPLHQALQPGVSELVGA